MEFNRNILGISDDQSSSLIKKGAVGSAHKRKSGDGNSLTWTEKYRPKVPNDIVGNQSIVCISGLTTSIDLSNIYLQLQIHNCSLQIKQLHDWLARWHEQFLYIGQKGKGKKQNDSGFKKAVLISGSPGIGKSTSAKLVSQMLGFKTIEVFLCLIYSLQWNSLHSWVCLTISLSFVTCSS